MNEQSNRTLVCSIMFLDIVEYSSEAGGRADALKQAFNMLLGRVLEDVAVARPHRARHR